MILTLDDLKKHPDGEPLNIEPKTMLTSAARDYADERGIEITEIEEGLRAADVDTSCECNMTPCSCDSSEMSGPSPGRESDRWEDGIRRRGPDPDLWRGVVSPRSAGPSSSDSGATETLGVRDTHLDGCFMGDGPCDEGDVVVVTAVGKNRPRVLAELAGGIADFGGDILDISQRIVDGYFHTILTVSIQRAEGTFKQAKETLESLSSSADYTVRVQHERVFRYMHRI